MLGLCRFSLDFSEFGYVSKNIEKVLDIKVNAGHSQIQKNQGPDIFLC